MKKIYSVLLLTLCFMAPSFIYAGDLGMYGSLKLGLFMPNDSFHSDTYPDGIDSVYSGSSVVNSGYNFDGMSGFDNVPTYGLAFGMLLNPNIALEIGWDMYDTELEVDFHNGDSAKYKIKTWSIPLTGKLLMPVSNKITAFLGAGIGYYDSEVDASETLAATVSGVGTFSDSDTESSTGFGVHAVAGADFMIDNNICLGLELKWTNAKIDFDDFTFFGTPYYMDRDTNVGGTSLFLTAKYMF